MTAKWAEDKASEILKGRTFGYGIDADFAQALEEERERAAKMCEEVTIVYSCAEPHEDDMSDACREIREQIAAAIRGGDDGR